jgi:hypothetical protein
MTINQRTSYLQRPTRCQIFMFLTFPTESFVLMNKFIKFDIHLAFYARIGLRASVILVCTFKPT